MEMVQQIQHRLHDHPLVLVEEQSNQKEKPYCYGCGEEISASSFSCLRCNYYLHKECALAPSTINHHPLHLHHSGFSLRSRPHTSRFGYVCSLCKEKRDMFFYECDECWFALDIKCSFLLNKVGESIYESKDDGHLLLENHKDELKKLDCSWCHRSLQDSICFSIHRKLYFHKKCFNQLPTEIGHPFHRLNTLLLQFDATYFICKLCQKEGHDNYFYRCFACKFDIHLECKDLLFMPRPSPIIEDKKYHKHPFTLLFRNDSFICDACGTNGKFVSYICSTCHLQVHKDCTSLPRIIKVTRHDHALVHKYGAHEKHDCGICFDEVKTEHGSYHCLREDCDFTVHVNCATEDENLYYIVDEDEEKLDETNSSSITRVIEVNEHGEAIKIQNLNHEHNLVLEDKIKEDSADRHCDGCMLSISTSTPLYYCSEYCNFFLHKPCAELPKIKHHWFHRFVATLESKDLKICYLCDRVCSGLFYESIKEHEFLFFCIRCAMVPNVIKCEGHKHILFYDYKCKGQCNGCGVDHRIGAFRCKECNFSLDFACMTLPPAIRHKCDAHLLKLSYHLDHDDTDPEEHVCDVCEEERDPNRCYYYCPICDNSVHPKCVLGRLPFVKDGATFRSDDHQHDVSFVRKVDGYHYCVDCGHLCQDEEALKCRECNFITHLECSEPLKELNVQQPKYTSAAGLVRKLHDLADNTDCFYGTTLQKDPTCTLPCSWSAGDPSSFLIRGKNYLKDQQKVKARETLMQMVGADWLISDKREDDLGSRLSGIVQKYAAQGGPEFFFIVNIQIPGSPMKTLAMYYMIKTPLEDHPLLYNFVNGDDAYRKSRFKLIPCISKGSWIVRQSVGKKACLLGQYLDVYYFRGKNYLEVEIDVGSSTVAQGVTSLVLEQLNNLVVEMAFLIEGNTQEELPEILLGTCRLNHLDLSKALLAVPDLNKTF